MGFLKRRMKTDFADYTDFFEGRNDALRCRRFFLITHYNEPITLTLSDVFLQSFYRREMDDLVG